jgi:hypothetical protein
MELTFLLRWQAQKISNLEEGDFGTPIREKEKDITVEVGKELQILQMFFTMQPNQFKTQIFLKKILSSTKLTI